MKKRSLYRTQDKQKLRYAPTIIQRLLDFAFDEVMALSKTTHDSAHHEYCNSGRGAYLIPLDESHFLHKKNFAMLYARQKDLLSLDCPTLHEFVALYDPLNQFVIFPFFKNGDITLWKPSILHHDAYQVASVQKDCNNQKIDPNPVTTIDITRCNYCTATLSKLKYCAKCRHAAYCSRECQTKDWTDHKPMCGTIKDIAEN